MNENITVLEGWIPANSDRDGNPQFHVIDGSGNILEFSIVRDGVYGIPPHIVGHTTPPAPTVATQSHHSTIDDDGWEILWETWDNTGQTVDGSIRKGRPPVTHSDIDIHGNEHLWETAWDGSGIVNARLRSGRTNIYGNGTNQPTGTVTNPNPGQTDLSKPAIQVGVAVDGSPVWQIQDRVGTIVQWVVRNGQAVYDSEHPTHYGAMLETNNTRAPIGAPDRSRPQIQVGVTAGGQPVYQVQDKAGVIQQWFLTAAGITDLHQVSTYGQLHHTAATDNAQTSPSLRKPVITVFTTAMGYPVKQLVDDAGVALQWIERPGNDDRRIVTTYGVLTHTALTDEQPQPGTGGPITTPSTTTKDNSSMWLGIAAVVGLGAYALSRRKSG